ncbi:thioesterase family protein [Microbispora corallina]|uniref:Thioesterase family protein n=1 Tax=Microbispora corallina TaxID=83302 RepID=A0ABQ4FWQ6_9ACTN|nr:thioesterase family protein [Microbispora corallina]GIH39250.1 hypothetical protein Mco01_22500 [Microbispora corallina]
MAMYVPLGPGCYRATEHTQGPWDPRQQHMGPVTALIAHELDRAPGLPPAKLAVEILAPVPVGDLEVRTEIIRDGRRVRCEGATVTAGGREVVRATAWRIREDATPATGVSPVPAPVPPPGQGDGSWLSRGFGYGRAVDWRFVKGGPDETGPALVWGRCRVPLVEGEEITPLERLAVFADSGNGVSGALDFETHLFVNVDLTISLFRAPAGEWFCLDASTTIGPSGRGLTRSTLFDEDGEVGAASQTLFVAPRSTG